MILKLWLLLLVLNIYLGMLSNVTEFAKWLKNHTIINNFYNIIMGILTLMILILLPIGVIEWIL